MTEAAPLDCPHGTRCGGCALLGLPYAEQLLHKQALVKRAFAHYLAHATLGVEPVSGATPTSGYRVRAKLVFDGKGALGLFARDSHEVVDIPECRMLAPSLLRVAAVAREQLGGGEPTLDGLDLRLVDRGVLVTLIAARGTPRAALERAAQALCSASADVVGVAASFREADAATVLGTGHVLLLGNEAEPHHLRRSGPYHLAAHGAFTQAHLGQAERASVAIERALRGRGARRVLELYAGSAALSLTLSAAGFELTAVEAFAPALFQAELAARAQGLALRTLSGTAERVTRELTARAEQFDAVVVNPPRRGLSLDVRRAVAQLAPAALIYMSCNPATLARDLGHLRELGYGASVLTPFDMIPYSDAVECLVVAERGEPPALRVLHEGGELFAVEQPGYLSGVPELLQRVRALPGAAAAVPLQLLDPDSSGIALFARAPASVPSLEAELARGSRTFIALVRGITHKKGRIRRPLKGVRASAPPVTAYKRLAVHGGHSLLQVEAGTGSTRQIREHFAGIGHPILGDAREGDAASNAYFAHRHGLDRSFLHCAGVRLTLGSGELSLDAPLPGELAAVLESTSEQAAPQRD